MLRLGLTGGIGSGKSTAARRLAEHGAVVVDADRLAREVVEPGTAGLAAVVAAFGPGVLTPDGALDRPALGRLVFGNDGARLLLNGILHPRIATLTAERMAAAGPDAVVVHDVPLLVENRLGPAYHLVLVVHAEAGERIRRLVADRGMPEEDARARVAAQADDDARRAAADVWLDNSGSPQDLVDAVDRLWDDRLAPYTENLRRHRPAGHVVHAGRGADEAAPARLRGRLRHVLGDAGRTLERADPDPGAGAGRWDVVLAVRDAEEARTAVARLADAGFLPDPADAADPADAVDAGTGPGEVLLRSADPGLGAVLHVRPAPTG